MARLFAPRVDGSYLVPRELVEQYKDTALRPNLEEEFLKAGLDKDLFVKRSIKKVKRRESEAELWVSGQFVSDGDMDELGMTEKRKKAVHDECAKMKGWIRRDRYEPEIKLYWLEKAVEGKVLKRKREIYEEEDSDVEMEASDDEKDLDVFNMSWGLGDGGPKGDEPRVAGADRTEDVRKSLKAISFPEMDADGLPSAYIVKVVTCLGKWNTKAGSIQEQLKEFKKTERSEKIMEKAKQLVSKIEQQSDKIQHMQAESALAGGFTLEQQSEIKKMFDESKQMLPDGI
ncbi:unnamed protein product [Symbiodinium necroappetens]|uniref:Uncharacterized protein n=1 Tax=Symbiodinium necroappetens TaxID=1628268 RepID=A0A812YSM1_9DINO|nr:unnamed protein product [Symbiodinium necroappetens]